MRCGPASAGGILGAWFALDAALRVHASEVVLTLALVSGAAAAAAVLFASYREQIVVRRLVSELRDPTRRPRAVARLRRRVDVALVGGDAARIEDAIRFAVEPLIIAGCWDDVDWFARHARGGRIAFRKWMAGVHALAHLHAGDAPAAAVALADVPLEGPWLLAVDAMRLAFDGRGDEALERLGAPPRKAGLAILHQWRLAEAHALAAAGRREEALARLRAMKEDGTDVLASVLDPAGPASGLAASLLAGGGGPFRAPS